MLWTPKQGILRVEHNTGAVGATNIGTTVTTGASSSTKGAVAELIASTSFDAYWMRVFATKYGGVAATAAQGCLDILIGAATEDVLIPNLLMGYCGGVGGRGAKVWDFPLHVPAGSRLSAQAAGIRTSTNLYVAVYLYGGDAYPPWRVGGHVTTYGIGTVPDGTTVTPGSSGAEGSWTEITASTTSGHFCLVPSFQCSGDTAIQAANVVVDLGVGSATESQIAEGYWFGTDTAEGMDGPYPSMPCFFDIPSGTRLVMRASHQGTPDLVNGAIHAVT